MMENHRNGPKKKHISRDLYHNAKENIRTRP